MNKKQVHTEQVPDQVRNSPDQVPTNQVRTASPGADATQPVSNQEEVLTEKVPSAKPGADKSGADNPGAGDLSNVTQIATARARRNSRKQPNQVPDDQTPISGTDASNGAVLCETDTSGADGTGAEKKKQVRKGRQPGAKDLKPRKKRYGGSITANIPPDEKQLIVRHNVEVWSLGKLKDKNNEEEVRERIVTYFSICEKNQQMPTVAGLALAFGVDRATLWDWMDGTRGTVKNPAVVDTIKEVYNLIASQYEGMLTQGKIVPVAGFFLMQNNFGYRNQTDHVVVAKPAEDPDTGDIVARAGLLTDGEP